jgi:lipopolysaccharide export system permease protein
MLTIDRYIARQVLVPTVLGLALLVLLFTGFTSVQLLRSAALGNLPARDVMALVMAHNLSALEVLLPSAFFAVLIMVNATWHREGEPYALYATGASPDRLSRPLRVLALFVALCVALLSVYGRPYSYVLRYEISERAANLTSRQMMPQRFYRWDADFVIQAQEIHDEAPNLSEVFARVTTNDRSAVLRARHGQINETDEFRRQRLEFLEGASYEIAPRVPPEDASSLGDRVTEFDRVVYRALRPPSDMTSRRRARSTSELVGSSALRDVAEFQWRLSMPVIAFLVALIAIELGRLRPKQSPYARFAVAIVVYALIFNLSNMTTTAVERGMLPAFPGVFTALIVMLAFYLLLRRMPKLTLREPA